MNTFEKNFWDTVNECKNNPETKKTPIGINLGEFHSGKYNILYKIFFKEKDRSIIIRADIPKGNDVYRLSTMIPLIELFERRYMQDTIGEYVLGELENEEFSPAYKEIWGLS